jgi:hypothetical protein
VTGVDLPFALHSKTLIRATFRSNIVAVEECILGTVEIGCTRKMLVKKQRIGL